MSLKANPSVLIGSCLVPYFAIRFHIQKLQCNEKDSNRFTVTIFDLTRLRNVQNIASPAQLSNLMIP